VAVVEVGAIMPHLSSVANSPGSAPANANAVTQRADNLDLVHPTCRRGSVWLSEQLFDISSFLGDRVIRRGQPARPCASLRTPYPGALGRGWDR
jgi:hypothetical protein